MSHRAANNRRAERLSATSPRIFKFFPTFSTYFSIQWLRFFQCSVEFFLFREFELRFEKLVLQSQNWIQLRKVQNKLYATIFRLTRNLSFSVRKKNSSNCCDIRTILIFAFITIFNFYTNFRCICWWLERLLWNLSQYLFGIHVWCWLNIGGVFFSFRFIIIRKVFKLSKSRNETIRFCFSNIFCRNFIITKGTVWSVDPNNFLTFWTL